jgi:tetratricopeptide (TPR) repeat protein
MLFLLNFEKSCYTTIFHMFRLFLFIGVLVSLSSWVRAQPRSVELTMEEANRIFAQAQVELNASRNQEALKLLEQVEPIFKAKLPIDAPKRVELLYQKSLCHLKLNLPIPNADRQQMIALVPMISGVNKAHILYTLGTEQAVKKNATETREYYQAALAIYEAEKSSPYVYTASICLNLGLFLREEGHLEQALKKLNQALQYFEQTLGENHYYTALALVNRGVILNELGLYDQAIQDFQRCLSIRYPLLPKYHADLNITHLSLGLAYANKGDYSRAEDYLVLALEGMLQNGPDRLSYAYVNLGLVEGGKNNLQAERAFYLKAAELEQGDSSEMAETHMNIAYTFQKEHNLIEAIKYYKKSLSLFPPQHRSKSRCLNNLGLTYLELNDFEVAKSFFRLALDDSKRIQGKNHFYSAYAYFNLSTAQLKQDSLYTALENNFLAQRAIGHQPGQAISNLVSLRELCPLLAQHLAISSRACELGLLDFTHQKNLALAQYTLNAFDLLRLSLWGSDAKTTIQGSQSSTIELALRAAKKLGSGTSKAKYCQQALQIAERTKSTVLLEAMHNAEIRVVNNVDPLVIKQEKELRQKITGLEKRRQEMLNTQTGTDDVALRQISLELSESNLQYEAVMRSLKMHAPILFDPQYTLKTISLSDIQQKILRN